MEIIAKMIDTLRRIDFSSRQTYNGIENIHFSSDCLVGDALMMPSFVLRRIQLYLTTHLWNSVYYYSS